MQVKIKCESSVFVKTRARISIPKISELVSVYVCANCTHYWIWGISGLPQVHICRLDHWK